MDSNLIVASNEFRIHIAATDDKETITKSAALLTEYLGSLRFVVRTISLAVKDIFTPQLI